MIRIRNLTKYFGTLAAVRDLSLDVPAGELFCLLGPNGAGKTTTIKMLTGLAKPSAGKAWIDGVDIQLDPVSAKGRMGYIPDMPFLYDRLSTAEFFEFSGQLYGLPDSLIREREAELFGVFTLDEQRATLVKDLSHGMRQRLIYASTLLHDPRVLFIDEPLIGLDPRTIRTIKDLLRTRARAGCTILLTTHILTLAQDIGDRIGIMLDGALAALGSLPDLLKDSGAEDIEDLFLRLTGTPVLSKDVP